MAFQEENEDDLKIKAENEYKKLKSKFPLIDSANEKCPNRLKSLLVQQERVLNILEEEKQELKTCIDVTTSKIYRKVEDKSLTKVYNCIEKEKKLDDKIMEEKSHIQDLKTEIENVKKQIIEFNKTDIQETKITESIIKSGKIIAYLEDKLQVGTTKFNDLLTLNAKYRGEIENLLNERTNFYKSYMRFYQQLLYGKQIMSDLVEQTATVSNQREDAYRKLQNLKEKTAAETKIQSKDVQDLKRKFEKTQQLYEFLSVCGQERILADLEAREAREKKKEHDEREEKIKNYTSLLQKITKLSKEENIDKFVARYLKIEEENIGLFSLANEVNYEVDFLQSEVTTLLNRIDEQRELNEKMSKEHNEIIDGLREKVNAKRETYETSLNKLESSEILLANLLYSIEDMFKSFECDAKIIFALLGNNAKVNVYNVMICLSLIEKQLYEFMYIAYSKERHALPEELIRGIVVQDDLHMIAAKRPLVVHVPLQSPCPLCVETDRILVLDENNESDTLEEYENVHKLLLEKSLSPDMNEVLHNISTCKLPRSRAIMQTRFQEQEHENVN